MRALSVVPLGQVTVVAKDLEARRKVVLLEPSMEHSRNLSSMLCTTTVYVIEAQELKGVLSATSTRRMLTTIGLKGL